MSVVLESQVIGTLFVTMFTALVPSAGTNVYSPEPEMPSGVYEGTYPYITYAITKHAMSRQEASGPGPQKRTDPANPNIWTFDLVDQLVSESGSTMAALEVFKLSFIDAVNIMFQRQTARYLIDSGGNGRATDCASVVEFIRNPDGSAQLRAGTPAIVLRGTFNTLSLPIPATND